MTHTRTIKHWIKPVLTTLLLLALVAAAGVAGATYAAKTSRAIAQQTLPSLSHLAQGTQCRGEAFLHLILAVDSSTEEQFQKEKFEVERISDRASEELLQYEKTIESDENRLLYDDLIRERGAYIALRNRILELRQSGDKNKANQILTSELLPMYSRYLSKGQKLVAYSNRVGVERADSISRIAMWSQILAIISSVLLFLFGFFLGFTR